VFGIAKYGSPLITMYLYKKGFFAAEHLGQLIKLSTGITVLVLLSYCIRGYGRSQSEIYRKFIKDLQEAKANPNDATNKKKVRGYDFEFEQWPIDWSIKSLTTKGNTSRALTPVRSERSNVNWISPCSVAAFVAIHTFGLRMIYPGSIGLIQKYLHQMLVQGRAKLVMQQKGIRNKVQAIDGNEIDTMFIDNRNSRFDNGKTLVITAEGNAGFYEIGIMGTPIDLHFSVLGFNHPGFAGSSGEPFPSQDQNAVDALMQFAIESLGFAPENILLFGWSIGGYSSLYLASQYPNIRGVILDATFDDILYLALPRMPESISSIVRIAIRDYCNLNNNDLITQYNGPVLMIRRTEDEVICTE
jgi:alpha/beta hydrolase fold